MAKEPLDSDRVNYLIWRYLLESDYRDTAIRLQKEWNLENPQTLSFAPHVTNHALVSVLNKGLLYQACERELTQTTRDVETTQPGVFGPVTVSRPAPVAEDERVVVRKRQGEEGSQSPSDGPLGKRLRLSNGYENGLTATPKSPTEMDVDEEPNGDGNAYPSPEQVPSPVVAVVGAEAGTQMEKVSELGSTTTFLDVSDHASACTTVLLQCAFHPTNPALLAAAGTDALARLWTLSRAESTSSTVAENPSNDMMQVDGVEQPQATQATTTTQQPSYLNLLDDAAPPTANVTSLAWTPDGQFMAVGSEPIDDTTARVDVWTIEGIATATLSGLEASVLTLQWNPTNALLLVLTPISVTGGILVTVWPLNAEAARFPLPGLSPGAHDVEAAWIGNEDFVICGGEIMHTFRYSGNTITTTRTFETRKGHALSKVAFDPHSQLLATASDTGEIDFWNQDGQSRSISAHQGVITSLLWQPYRGSTPIGGEDEERLLVSAGEDNVISIWNARSPAKAKASMTMDSAVVGLAFAPDGAFLAGATVDKILIWKVDNVHIPRAIWHRGSEVGWQTPKSQVSAVDEDQHCLCWDADGQKLAYGVNSQLAVIQFQR